VGHHAPAEADEHFTSGYGWGVDRPVDRRGARYFAASSGSAVSCRRAQAFQQVQDALSFFVQSYKEISAVVCRGRAARDFERALEHVRRQATIAASGARGRPTN